MSSVRASGEALLFAGSEPAMLLSSPKVVDSDQIGKMLLGVYEHEKHIARLEKLAASESRARRYTLLPGESRPRFVGLKERALAEIDQARADRDAHVAELRSVIKEALAAMSGNKESREYRRVNHFRRVLDSCADAAKVKYGTSDADDAYQRIEDAHIGMLKKFSNELQTSMESEDAAQGVRMGILDAIRIYDPTRGEQAVLSTVIYNWAFRNSRARMHGDKRAGVYAPSVDGMNTERPITEQLSGRQGGLSTFSTATTGETSSLAMDLRQALTVLSGPSREIIELELQGFAVRDIAARLDLKQSKVRRLRKTALAEMRERLGAYAEVLCD